MSYDPVAAYESMPPEVREKVDRLTAQKCHAEQVAPPTPAKRPGKVGT